MSIDNLKLNNPDVCKVFLYILENNLSVDFFPTQEDLETLAFNSIIDYDYQESKWLISKKDFKSFQQRIPEYRELFSVKTIGVNKASSPKAVLEKLQKFNREYPEYTMDDIIEAAKLHIQETNPKYVKKANNFLFKKEGNSTWESVCLEYILRIKETKASTQTNFI